jgi:serine/threonine protein phosphatase 1
MASSAETIPSGFKIPDGVRLYAFGDIHGRADLLRQKLKHIDSHLASDPCSRHIRIFLGDYIDRGPDSRGVIETLIATGQKHESVFLRGNHETFMQDFLHNPAILSAWKTLGGIETLASYGLSLPLIPDLTASLQLADELNAALPDSHRLFLEQLRPYFEFGDLFFAHAGVRPGIPLVEQSEADLMWIRDDFLNHEGSFGKLVIHGHTPFRTPQIRHNRINIDTRAWSSGNLTCLWLEGDRYGFL